MNYQKLCQLLVEHWITTTLAALVMLFTFLQQIEFFFFLQGRVANALLYPPPSPFTLAWKSLNSELFCSQTGYPSKLDNSVYLAILCIAGIKIEVKILNYGFQIIALKIVGTLPGASVELLRSNQLLFSIKSILLKTYIKML